MVGNQGKRKGFFRHLLSDIVLGLPYSEGTLMRGGLRVLLGGLGRRRLPNTVRPNGRVHCTKCALGLMTRLASRVVGEFLVMMMSTKALLVAQWIGLLSAGTTVNSRVSVLVLQVHLSMLDIVTLIMSRHGGAGAHNLLERTG